MTKILRPIYLQNRVPVVLKPHLRFAIAKLFLMSGANSELLCGGPEVGNLAIEALALRGWYEDRIHREYLKYAAQCAEDGVDNQFPGARL